MAIELTKASGGAILAPRPELAPPPAGSLQFSAIRVHARSCSQCSQARYCLTCDILTKVVTSGAPLSAFAAKPSPGTEHAVRRRAFLLQNLGRKPSPAEEAALDALARPHGHRQPSPPDVTYVRCASDGDCQANIAADEQAGVLVPPDSHTPDALVAPVFLHKPKDWAYARGRWTSTPRPGKSPRMIVDLRKANSALIRTPIIQYDTLAQLLAPLQPKMYIAVADLSSAYHSVRLSADSEQYATLATPSGRRLRSTCIPFGSSLGPPLFSFVSAVLITAWRREIRRAGMRAWAIQYLDDTGIVAATEAEAWYGLLLLLSLAKTMGFTVQTKKSVAPRQVATILGVEITTSPHVRVGLPVDKIARVRTLLRGCNQCINSPTPVAIPPQVWRHMAGFLEHASLVDPRMSPRMAGLHLAAALAQVGLRHPAAGLSHAARLCRRHFQWLASRFEADSNTFSSPMVVLPSHLGPLMHPASMAALAAKLHSPHSLRGAAVGGSDASDATASAWLPSNRIIVRALPLELRPESSMVRELAAIWLGVSESLRTLKLHQLVWVTDSAAAAYALTKARAGTLHGSRIVERIIDLCGEHHCTLWPVWLPRLSRIPEMCDFAGKASISAFSARFGSADQIPQREISQKALAIITNGSGET